MTFTQPRLHPERIAEIVARAKLDVLALKSGWPSRGCPYSDAASATLWCHEYATALKEGQK